MTARYTVSCTENPTWLSYTVRRSHSALSTLLAVVLVLLSVRFGPATRAGIASFACGLCSFGCRSQSEESVTVFPGLGIQLSRRARFSFLAAVPLGSRTSSDHFVPLESIRDVVIDERIQGAGFKYVLAVVFAQGEQLETSVAFSGALPRLEDLTTILKRIQSSLALDSDQKRRVNLV
ncbi:hypothetical protein JCM11491_006611 [Sporobolomyces phaffii]